MNLSNVVGTAKRVLSDPKGFWEAEKITPIEGAPSTTQVLLEYAAPLAALAAVGAFIQSSILGITIPMVGTIRVGIGEGISHALFGFVVTFISIGILVAVTTKLAPMFGGQVGTALAVRLIVFSMTGSWIGGFLIIIPVVGFIVALVLGIYSLYILWQGMRILAIVPETSLLKYFAAVCVSAIVLNLILHLVLSPGVAAPGPRLPTT